MPHLVQTQIYSRIIAASLALLQVTSAFAGSFRTTGNINGRSSLNFRGRENIKTIIPEGTEGKVLERWKLPSGNYGIKIKVENLGSRNTSSKLKEGDEVWVYYHKDENLRLVELYDDEADTNGGAPVNNPEDGKWAVALKTFKVATPPAIEKDSICTNCNGLNTTLEMPKELISATQIIENVKEIPEVENGVEEIATFLNRYRNQPETNRKIAKAALNEAEANGVSIAFILAVMAAESNFKTSARSSAGAHGLMQLMPGAWAAVMGKGVPRSMDVETNIRAGVRYLALMLNKYDGNEDLALYAYKNGPGNADKYIRGIQRKSRTTVQYEKNIHEFKFNYLTYQAKTEYNVARN